MKNAIIIGATGFGGLGLIEILQRHPQIRIDQLIARKETDVPVSSVFPHLEGFCDIDVKSSEDIDYTNIDIAFFSTPDRVGMSIIKDFFNRGIPVIDFSGDFRFQSIEQYSQYARNRGLDISHNAQDILTQSVYGLPEIYSEKIRKAQVVGNPGCFSISMILSLLPAVVEGIINTEKIICDGKTGVSGAGKNPGEANFYPQRYEDVNTYREGRHQHVVEVEGILNENGKTDTKIFFIPQIVPLNRGILITAYADVDEGFNTEKVYSLYHEYYKNKPFVMVTKRSPHTTDVRGTNRCVIKPMVDDRTGKLAVISVIDNLVKGQAGNAVQNANIMLGFKETTGINIPAFYP